MRLYLSYVLFLLLLFLYSYTQVDLSLTFSSNDFLRELVKSFQYIGYFQRPSSTLFYFLLVIGFFAFYGVFLYLAWKKKISQKYAWLLVGTTIAMLTFSYNALSHDIFSYIFDAKILVFYHQNPYLQKPLDYPNDPMLSFMHWTHRTYPYGPVWLVLTVPLSFLGFQYFLPTFFLFKLLMAGSFLGSVVMVGKILRKIAPNWEIFGKLFIGLQPLLLLESVVSAHLDIVMLFFSLWAFYLLVEKRHVWGLVVLLVSIGIKFATVFLLPIFLLVWYWQYKGRKVAWQKVFLSATALMLFAAIVMSFRTTFQPWYLVGALCFAAVVGYARLVFIPSILLSFFALLIYLPFLYQGNWDPPVPFVITVLQLASIILSLIALGIAFYSQKKMIKS